MLYQSSNPHGGDIYADEDIVLDYSANTNPLGTPEGVLDAMKRALSKTYQYPDPYCRKLVQAISESEQLPKEYILCGNGAAELIYAYCEAIRATHAVELAPTFSEYSSAMKRFGCGVDRYFLKKRITSIREMIFFPILPSKNRTLSFCATPTIRQGGCSRLRC